MKRLIVKFKPTEGDAEDTIESLVKEILGIVPGAKLVRPPSRSGRAVFIVDPDTDVADVAKELMQDEKIAYAEPDTIDRAMEEE